MSELHTLQLNLRESSIYYDNDDDEFQSVSGSIGEDKDTYRVLDEALIGTSKLYAPELFKTNNQEGRFVELHEYSQDNSSWDRRDNCANTGPADPLLSERLAGSADAKMLGPMDGLPVREIEELRQERDYQFVMKKRISNEMQRDTNYSLPRLPDNDDNNNNSHTDNIDDQAVHQISNIDCNRQNPEAVDDDYNEEDNLYDSLEAEQPPRSHEYRLFPSNSNPLQPAFNDDNLDQFYPKSPQKELKSIGPVKGDHMLFSQMWSDEQLYHELEKMANDYNKNQTLHDPNFVQPSYQENENGIPPPLMDFLGPNPMDYQESPREKFWNNLSNKPPIPKQNPVSMDFVRKPKIVPKQASTNYVEYNKINYSKFNQNKSYMARHYLRKDVSGSLSKLPSERQVYSGRSEPTYGTQPHLMPLWHKPSSAEDSRKKQSAKLIYQMEQKLPPPPGKLQKYPSDSRVNYRNSRPHYLQPLQTNGQPSGALVPMDQRSCMSSSSVIDMVPISKDFVMEDGQRISVDISLKLVTPPVSSRMTNDEANTRTFQPLQPCYANGQANQTVNLKNPSSTTHRDHQDQFSLQPLPDPRREICPAFEYEGPNNSTEETLNSKAGYVARYQRQRDPKPHYKVYSVDDYRKMQKEVKLGKLGPDLDSETLREKVEKRQKQFEYAKKVHETNKVSLKSQKPIGPPQPQRFITEEQQNRRKLVEKRQKQFEYAKKVHETNKVSLKSQKPIGPPQPQRFITEEQQNRRKLAIEYAKSVPKPAVKPTAGYMPQEGPPWTQNQLPAINPDKTKNTTKPAKLLLNCEDLEQLCLRHEQDKRNAESIRKKITPPS